MGQPWEGDVAVGRGYLVGSSRRGRAVSACLSLSLCVCLCVRVHLPGRPPTAPREGRNTKDESSPSCVNVGLCLSLSLLQHTHPHTHYSAAILSLSFSISFCPSWLLSTPPPLSVFLSFFRLLSAVTLVGGHFSSLLGVRASRPALWFLRSVHIVPPPPPSSSFPFLCVLRHSPFQVCVCVHVSVCVSNCGGCASA